MIACAPESRRARATSSTSGAVSRFLRLLAITLVVCCGKPGRHEGVLLEQAAPPPSAESNAAPGVDEASAPISAAAGHDFIAETRDLYRVAACGGRSDVPVGVDVSVVDTHCREVERLYRRYTTAWLARATPFLAALRPADLPARVVYPFGGGDLVTALATFPDADEITTISLEPAGDVRALRTLSPGAVPRALELFRTHLSFLLQRTFLSTINLGTESHGALPGEVVLSLAALAIHGFEPVSLHYFVIRDDGTLRYRDEQEVEHAGRGSGVFDNVELTFARARDGGRPKVLRHISHNLDDAHFRADGALFSYLASQGRIAAMTKAASHLLWSGDFSRIRSYLLEHTDWMISDSTGIPPRFAQAAGFVQDTYGLFDGPAHYGRIDARDTADFRALFDENPQRRVPFAYGYLDRSGHAHLVVTRRGHR